MTHQENQLLRFVTADVVYLACYPGLTYPGLYYVVGLNQDFSPGREEFYWDSHLATVDDFGSLVKVHEGLFIHLPPANFYYEAPPYLFWVGVVISVTHHGNSGGGVAMAKQAADTFTRDLLDKPKRGRPRKPDALTPAQRARAYRARKRFAQRLKALGWED